MFQRLLLILRVGICTLQASGRGTRVPEATAGRDTAGQNKLSLSHVCQPALADDLLALALAACFA